jgi:hypothetical protein
MPCVSCGREERAGEGGGEKARDWFKKVLALEVTPGFEF